MVIKNNPINEHENRKINSGFRYDVKNLEPVKPEVGLISKEDDKDNHDKIVCVRCTDSFFRIFLAEQTQDKQALNDDPILQDIYTKKIFMKEDKEQGIYYCNGCGNKIVKDQTVITNPKKILKVAGVDPRKQTTDLQDFALAVDRSKKQQDEIEYYDEVEIKAFDSKEF